MALFNRTEIGFKETSSSATVPNNPTARLMYYLNCICSVLNMDDDEDINRLRRYNQYHTLSDRERTILIQLCLLLKPDLLLNKCIFQSDAMCGDSGNKFYEIERVRNNLLVAGNILIGGRNRRVTSIMTFKMDWLTRNWSEPLKDLVEQQQRAERQRALEQQRRQRALEQQRMEERQRALEQRRREEKSSCHVM